MEQALLTSAFTLLGVLIAARLHFVLSRKAKIEELLWSSRTKLYSRILYKVDSLNTKTKKISTFPKLKWL